MLNSHGAFVSGLGVNAVNPIHRFTDRAFVLVILVAAAGGLPRLVLVDRILGAGTAWPDVQLGVAEGTI
jgi:hypothetical protein